MKKICTIILLAAIVASTGFSQSLEDILKNHSEVMGFAKLTTVKTTIIHGKSKRGDNDMPFTQYIDGSKSRYESEMMGMKIVRVFDGEKGWTTNPRDGSVRELTGQQANRMNQGGQIGGILFNWKKNGFQVNLEGKEKFEGTDVFKIKVTRNEGAVTYAFLDAESFVLLKQSSIRVVQDNEIESTTTFSNYKMVDGIAVAFNSATTSSGGGGQGRGGRGMGGGTQVIEKVEFNKPIDDALFSKPGN